MEGNGGRTPCGGGCASGGAAGAGQTQIWRTLVVLTIILSDTTCSPAHTISPRSRLGPRATEGLDTLQGAALASEHSSQHSAALASADHSLDSDALANAHSSHDSAALASVYSSPDSAALASAHSSPHSAALASVHYSPDSATLASTHSSLDSSALTSEHFSFDSAALTSVQSSSHSAVLSSANVTLRRDGRSVSLTTPRSYLQQLFLPAPSNVVACALRGLCGDHDAIRRDGGDYSGDPRVPPSQFSFSQNCFCDVLCTIYDDCCRDYRAPPVTSHLAPFDPLPPSSADKAFLQPETSRDDAPFRDNQESVWAAAAAFSIPRTAISCQRIPDAAAAPGGADGSPAAELYVVTRCAASLKASLGTGTASDGSRKVPEGSRAGLGADGSKAGLGEEGSRTGPPFDEYMRKRCEWDGSPGAGVSEDRFYRLPVRGAAPLRLLYRNVYCALCAGETSAVFWRAVLRCGGYAPPAPGWTGVNWTAEAVLGLVRSGACPVSFVADDEEGTPAPRRCKVHIGRCERSWRDRGVARLCRAGSTDYVYAGTRTFRNRDCAACNYVNETYLRCEDSRAAPPGGEGPERVSLEDHAPHVVTLDFNGRRVSVLTKLRSPAPQHVGGRPGPAYHVTENIIDFPHCPVGQVFDPFSGQCLLVGCPAGQAFLGGACVVAATSVTAEANDWQGADVRGDMFSGGRREEVWGGERGDARAPFSPAFYGDELYEDAGDSVRQWDLEDSAGVQSSGVPRCPLRLVNDSDYVLYDNGSLLVVSLQQIFSSSQHTLYQDRVRYVCDYRTGTSAVDGIASSVVVLARVGVYTLFEFERSVERMAGFIAGFVGAMLLLVAVIVCAACGALRAGPAGRSALCLLVSLHARHALYAALVLPWSHEGELLRPPWPAVDSGANADVVEASSVACFVLTSLLQYFVLASFCWLNVLAVDLVRVLKTNGVSRDATVGRHVCVRWAAPPSDQRRFAWYSLYAWGVPLVVVSGSVAAALLDVDKLGRGDSGGSIVKSVTSYPDDPYIVHSSPQGYHTSCALMGLSQLVLFAVSISLLFALNVLLYVITAIHICCGSASSGISLGVIAGSAGSTGCGRAGRVSDGTGRGGLRCVAAVQLTVLAGTAWMFALVAAVTRQTVLWRLFAVLDSLEVLFVCCAFMCTRRTARLLRQRGRVREAVRGTASGGGGCVGGRGGGGAVGSHLLNGSGLARGVVKEGTKVSGGSCNGKVPFVVDLKNSGIVMLETSI